METSYIEQEKKNIEKSLKQPHSSKIPLLKQLLCFFIGWAGLTVIAIIISFIVSLFPIDKTSDTAKIQLNVIINFSSYFLLVGILFLILQLDGIKHIFKDFKNINNILKGVIYGVIILVTTIIYNVIMSVLVPGFGSNDNQSSIVKMVQLNPVMTFFVVVIFAPVTEEITYRLGLFGACRRKNRIFGYILSLTIFGLIHTPFLDFSFIGMSQEKILNELLNLPGYLIPGFIFAFAYDREDSLSVSMTAHMTNNLVGFIQILLTLFIK